jgi:hypothetical protein
MIQKMAEKVEKATKQWTRQTENNAMVNQPTTSIITLNRNNPMKRQRLLKGR